MKRMVLVLAALLSVLACTGERPAPEKTVIENYRALEAEDAEAYRQTVGGARASVADTLLEELFNDYDVTYEIDTIELLSMVGDVAQVRTVVTARDVGGPNKYHDNNMEAVHKLKYENGSWRIHFTEVGRPKLGSPEVRTGRTSRDTSR